MRSRSYRPSRSRAARRPLALRAGIAGMLLLAAAAQPAGAAPVVPADAWLLQAVSSGRVLAGRNADERRQPGSLAKLMTAYVAFEAAARGRIDYAERVRISAREWRMSGSQMFLEVDEEVTVDRLLQGMLIAGGNDAAHALARHVGLGVDAFVRLMNRRAQALGMRHTHFTNPSGLPDPQQRTTARDMATFAAALIEEFPKQYRRFTDEAITHNGIRQRNRNPVLGIVRGADGLMTGYTNAGGYHLVASARRDDMRLVAVLLGARTTGDRLQGSMALLRHGFRTYESVRVARANRPLARARVWTGRSDLVDAVLERPLYVTVRRDRADSLETATRLTRALHAPIEAGERVGWLTVGTAAGSLAREPLRAARAVPAGGWIDYIVDTVRLRWQTFWRRQQRELFADGAGDAAGGAPDPS